LALSLAFVRAGSNIAAKMAMMAMTTNNSINVNPLGSRVSGLISGPGQFPMASVFTAFGSHSLASFYSTISPRNVTLQLTAANCCRGQKKNVSISSCHLSVGQLPFNKKVACSIFNDERERKIFRDPEGPA
jgi:hypothetical protein